MLGIAALGAGHPHHAVLLFSAVDHHYPNLYKIQAPLEREEYDAAYQAARTALGEDAFHSAWKEGQGLSREAAFAVAHESAELI